MKANLGLCALGSGDGLALLWQASKATSRPAGGERKTLLTRGGWRGVSFSSRYLNLIDLSWVDKKEA